MPWFLFVLLPALGFGPLAAGPRSQRAQAPLKEEISSLLPVLGLWDWDGTFARTGKQISSSISFAPVLEGAWVRMQQDDRPPNQFHALEMWGFDENAKQFTNFIYDNFGGVRSFTSPGWSGKQLVWTGETSPQQTRERFIFEQSSGSALVVTWQVRKGEGDWVVGDTLTCHAQK
jgi:hypothetical protein